MLDKIKFTDNDVLYVLGDVVDWGTHPIKVLQDMSMRANVYPIMGNHEYIAYDILKELLFDFVVLTKETIKRHFGKQSENFSQLIADWIAIGGQATFESFAKLPLDNRKAIIEYLSEFSLYETVDINSKQYILTHSGLPDGAAPDNLDDFDAYDFNTADVDYNKKYFDDTIFLVTGHYPTKNFKDIDSTERGRIYRKNNHIAIDTGAVFGEAMGCLYLETGEEFYV
jgi:serine/threonine protein phosphatase 1